jgi:hypothetical protein
VNVLDENVIESQCQLLRKWRIRFRQIGVDFGQAGIQDDDLVRLLHRSRNVTFFTRDDDFSEQRLCHAAYCIVVLDVGQYEVASFTRRVLRHARFRTNAQRMGKVLTASQNLIRCYSAGTSDVELIQWSTARPRRPK